MALEAAHLRPAPGLARKHMRAKMFVQASLIDGAGLIEVGAVHGMTESTAKLTSL
jgi:hypothetical protein